MNEGEPQRERESGLVTIEISDALILLVIADALRDIRYNGDVLGIHTKLRSREQIHAVYRYN